MAIENIKQQQVILSLKLDFSVLVKGNIIKKGKEFIEFDFSTVELLQAIQNKLDESHLFCKVEERRDGRVG